jgi:hypothetical protein
MVVEVAGGSFRAYTLAVLQPDPHGAVYVFVRLLLPLFVAQGGRGG